MAEVQKRPEELVILKRRDDIVAKEQTKSKKYDTKKIKELSVRTPAQFAKPYGK